MGYILPHEDVHVYIIFIVIIFVVRWPWTVDRTLKSKSLSEETVCSWQAVTLQKLILQSLWCDLVWLTGNADMANYPVTNFSQSEVTCAAGRISKSNYPLTKSFFQTFNLLLQVPLHLEDRSHREKCHRFSLPRLQCYPCQAEVS